MATKICKQCGDLKPIEQFRKYYGGRKGTYRTCKLCEKINARFKYLKSKGEENLNDNEKVELDKIYLLYDAQRKAGLQPPREGAGRNVPIADSLDDMISKYSKQAESVSTLSVDTPVPAEITKWLTAELTEEPDYYLDDVYEALKAKYRPQLSINTETMQPVYDDTHKEALDKVLERFYEYEENYWRD